MEWDYKYEGQESVALPQRLWSFYDKFRRVDEIFQVQEYWLKVTRVDEKNHAIKFTVAA